MKNTIILEKFKLELDEMIDEAKSSVKSTMHAEADVHLYYVAQKNTLINIKNTLNRIKDVM